MRLWKLRLWERLQGNGLSSDYRTERMPSLGGLSCLLVVLKGDVLSVWRRLKGLGYLCSLKFSNLEMVDTLFGNSCRSRLPRAYRLTPQLWFWLAFCMPWVSARVTLETFRMLPKGKCGLGGGVSPYQNRPNRQNRQNCQAGAAVPVSRALSAEIGGGGWEETAKTVKTATTAKRYTPPRPHPPFEEFRDIRHAQRTKRNTCNVWDWAHQAIESLERFCHQKVQSQRIPGGGAKQAVLIAGINRNR